MECGGVKYEVVDYYPNQWARLSGREARTKYRELMAVRANRIDQLQWLSGELLDHSDDSLMALNSWLVDNVQPNPFNDEIPNGLWRSVSRDIGLYVGEVIISRYSWLRWELRTTGRTFVDYRELVIRGFKNVISPGYEIGPCGIVFRNSCNALNTSRVSQVEIDGSLIEIDLGPIKRDTYVGVVNGVDEFA